MNLTEDEIVMLATLYEMPHYALFRKVVLEQRQLELAQLAPFLPNMEAVAETRGKIMELRQVEKTMKGFSKEQDKRRDHNG